MTRGRKKQEIPQWVKDEMIKAYRTMPYHQVAKLFGIGRNRTWEIVKGTRKQKYGRADISGRDKSICEDYMNGVSIKKLCEKHGLTADPIYKILRKNAVDLHEHTRVLSVQKDIKAGELTQSQIAKKHGVSRQRVFTLKKQMEDKNNEIVAQ